MEFGDICNAILENYLNTYKLKCDAYIITFVNTNDYSGSKIVYRQLQIIFQKLQLSVAITAAIEATIALLDVYYITLSCIKMVALKIE